MGSIAGRTGALLLLGCVAACSPSPSAPSGGLTTGEATLDGTFTFMPAHYSASVAASQADANHASIVVTSLRGTDSCSAVQVSAGAGVANRFQVVVTFDSSDSKRGLAPGTYTLGDGWQASYGLADMTCASAGQGDAIKGSLEIDSVDMSIHGIADMTFPTGRVIASFDAPLCASSVATSTGTACAHVPLCPAGQGTDLNPTPTETCNEIP
jgi:hypothetical protein